LTLTGGRNPTYLRKLREPYHSGRHHETGRQRLYIEREIDASQATITSTEVYRCLFVYKKTVLAKSATDFLLLTSGPIPTSSPPLHPPPSNIKSIESVDSTHRFIKMFSLHYGSYVSKLSGNSSADAPAVTRRSNAVSESSTGSRNSTSASSKHAKGSLSAYASSTASGIWNDAGSSQRLMMQ
jgi:hypothetical protein